MVDIFNKENINPMEAEHIPNVSGASSRILLGACPCGSQTIRLDRLDRRPQGTEITALDNALPRAFYQRDANLVAPELLGKLLVSESPEGRTAGMIVEVEAYKGSCDKGAHSYKNKRTERTKIQFGPGGFAYVFRIYGLHSCFNVVTNREEVPDVVLVRALEPVEGLALMEQRRGCGVPARFCNGPGKLCQALNITDADYGTDLLGPRLYIAPYRQIKKSEIMVSPRINIDYAEECIGFPWRYFIKNSPWVSKVPGKYQAEAAPFLSAPSGIK